MFTAGEIDKVMKRAQYSEGKEITADHILEIVSAARDCGVLHNRIEVWKLDEGEGFLVIFAVGTLLRLSSPPVLSAHMLGKPSRMGATRDAVFEVMVSVQDAALTLMRVHRDLVVMITGEES